MMSRLTSGRGQTDTRILRAPRQPIFRPLDVQLGRQDGWSYFLILLLMTTTSTVGLREDEHLLYTTNINKSDVARERVK